MRGCSYGRSMFFIPRVYKGSGHLTSEHGILDCQFTASQRPDGAIVIDCSGDATRLPHNWGWDARLTGHTDDGARIETEGAHIVSSSLTMGGQGPSTRIRVISERLHIAKGQAAPIAYRYGLTNLRRLTPVQTPEGEIAVLIQAGDHEFRFKHASSDEITELTQTRSIGVTAEASVATTSGRAGELDEVIGRLCDLFTLGQASAVHWIYREALDANGDIVETVCLDAPTKPSGAAHRLIPDVNLRSFVESTYPRWDPAEANWEIRRAILGYTDAKVQVDYLEMRALKVAVVLEHLKSVFVRRTGREFTVANDLYQERVPTLRTRVMAVLKEVFEGQPGEALGQVVAGFVGGLNRRSFKDALKTMAAELRLPLGNDELRTLVPIRDHLVHTMSFDATAGLPPEKQYELLTTLVGRFLLAALEYDGPFYDWTGPRPEVRALLRLPPNNA